MIQTFRMPLDTDGEGMSVLFYGFYDAVGRLCRHLQIPPGTIDTLVMETVDIGGISQNIR